MLNGELTQDMTRAIKREDVRAMIKTVVEE
jgi:hypothetical protein